MPDCGFSTAAGHRMRAVIFGLAIALCVLARLTDAAGAVDEPASATDVAEPGILDERQFGFRLRVPEGWSIEIEAEDGPMLSWRMHRDSWLAGDVPRGLLALNVTVIEPDIGKDIEAEFRGFVAKYGDRYLGGGNVASFATRDFGAYPGFRAAIDGQIGRPSGERVNVSAHVILYLTPDRQVIITAVAPPAFAHLLDELGRTGSLIEAAGPQGDRQPADTGAVVTIPPDPGSQTPSPSAASMTEILLPDSLDRLRAVSWGGGSLEEFGRTDPDGLTIMLPPGARTGGVGLASRGSPVRLGDLERGDATTLRLALAPDETDSMLLILCPGEMVPCISEPGLQLQLESRTEGAMLTILSEAIPLAQAKLPRLPEHLSLRIDRDGLYIFPTIGEAMLDPRPKSLTSFAALNVLVAATPIPTGGRLHVRALQARTDRSGSGRARLASGTATGLFPGETGSWQGIASNGGDFAAFASLDEQGLTVAVPPGRSWGTTGIVSTRPLASLPDGADPDIAQRFHGVVDPASSSSFAIALVPGAEGDVWLSSSVYADLARLPDDRIRMRIHTCGSGTRVAEAIADPSWDGTFDLMLLPDRVDFMVGEQSLSTPFLACRMPAEGAHVAIHAVAPRENEAASLRLTGLAIARLSGSRGESSGSAGPDAEFRPEQWIADTIAELQQDRQDR